MKQRIPMRLLLLSVLFAALSMLAVAAADCGDSHAWDEGKILWNADYTAAVGEWTCSNCKDTKTVDAFVSIDRTEPTCEEPGSIFSKAYASLGKNLCNDSHTIELVQLGHVYAEPQFMWNTVDFKCQASWVCTVCDETGIEDCDITKSTYPADGLTPGGIIYVAYIEIDGKTYADTLTVEGDPTGHDYCTPVFYWSDDYTSARIESICSICKPGDPERILRAECRITRRIEEADCFSDGYGEYIARADLLGQVWEEKKTVIFSKLQHDYPTPTFVWEDGVCTVICACKYCETPYPADCTISEQKTYIDCTSPGTLTRTAKITVDGVTYSDSADEEISAKGHTQVRIPGKEPTCTEVGMTDGIACSACEAILLKQTEIPALGHTDAAITGTDATCTEDGKTDQIFCTVCGKTLRKSTVIPATGHTQKIVPGYEPTCEEDGRGDGEICTVCEKVLVEQKIIPAFGHTPLALETREVTCTENGYSAGEICSVCDTILVKQTILYAKGHTEKTQKGYAATCTEKGLTDGVICSVCQEILKKQEIIPAKGHTPQKLEARAPTCTENGLTDGKKCSVCQKILEEQQTIPEKGHKPKSLTGYTATCTESGLTDGEICTVCQEVLREQKIIPAKGHTLEKQDVYPATCTEPGYTEGNQCVVCKEEFERGVILPLGHRPQTIDGLDATCTEEGLTEGKICTVCEEILEEQTVISAEGHRSAAMDTQDATCENEGHTGGSICSVCQTVLEEPTVVPPAGHAPTEKKGLAPTCTEPGYTDSEICSICKTVLVKSTELPPIGHTMTEKEGLAPTCTKPGYTGSGVCSVCRTTIGESAELPALGHQWGTPTFVWSEDHHSAKAEKICDVCDTIFSAVARIAKAEITENGRDMIQFTATAVFSDGTTASDVKKIASDPVSPDPEPPITPPVEPIQPDPGSQPEPEVKQEPEEPMIPQFDDVASDSYYYDAVVWAAKLKITQGTADRIFSPDMVCSRAQIVTMLWRAAGSPITEGTTAFTDVPPTAYYAHAVLWAAEQGITAGTSQMTFSPELQCTRAQIVTMLWRAAGCPVSAASVFFSDVAADAWYAGAVAWAVESGITLGTGEGIFSPDAVCTRAQIVTFLYRARNLW